MHDRSLNVPALKKIIPYLREQGYIFSTLDHYPEKSYHTMPIYSRDHADLPSKSVSITHATYSIYAGGEILLVRGTNDEIVNLERYEQARDNYPEDVREVTIAGGNHAYFGDYGEQDGDGMATISSDDQQRQCVDAIVELVDE